VGPVGASVKWAKAWLIRLCIAYVVLYALPFPLTLLGYLPRIPLLGDIPGLEPAVGFLVGLYFRMSPLVSWVGRAVFGVEATRQTTGSGDTTFDYVLVFVILVFAILVATAWTAVVATRRRPDRVSPRLFDASRVIARFYLGTTLLSYGWDKVVPLQFPLPGPDRLLQPYGDSSPMGLAWTFLGASTAYQVFGGLCELLGGYLLFWRRTALVGALVSAAVLTNVMAINYFYDVPVKLFSTHLFLIAIFIAAPDLPRLRGLIGFQTPPPPRPDRPFWHATGRRRVAILVGHLLLIGTITAFHPIDLLQFARTSGFLREASPLAGIYRVESFERGGVMDRDNADDDRWVRVGMNPPGIATIQRASGVAVRMRLAVDEEGRTVSFFDRGGQPPPEPQFSYTLIEPGLVRLAGEFEGAATVVTMRRLEEASLLRERGYHWINEFPFNR